MPEILSKSDKILDQVYIVNRLKELAGNWEGTGNAEYPTIEHAEYKEELLINCNSTEQLIHYEQKTWKLSPGGEIIDTLNWQSGFFIVQENGEITFVNAQNSGRTEVMKGNMYNGNEPGKYKLILQSIAFGNDERMLSATREYLFTKNTIEYEMKMKTTMVERLAMHLSCKLVRV